jgi:hypothetical protein
MHSVFRVYTRQYCKASAIELAAFNCFIPKLLNGFTYSLSICFGRIVSYSNTTSLVYLKQSLTNP